MTNSRRHDHRVVLADLHAVSRDDHLALALLDTEELVVILVDILAGLLAGLERHQNQLHVLAGIENAPIVLVLLSQLLNVLDKALHDGPLLQGRIMAVTIP